MRHVHIAPVAASLPSELLEGANWADAYEWTGLHGPATASEAANTMFGGRPPLWVRALNAIRNGIVAPFGIRPGRISIDAETEGAFPVTHCTRETVVYGFDDRHLDFRIVIALRQADEEPGCAVRLTTLVRRNTRFGSCYLFLIQPFHRLIVRSLLRRLAP